ncbi:hypothetical protein GCM10020218_093120 [Dactylosporangium vinaceum]
MDHRQRENGNGHYGTAWEADDHADKSPKAVRAGGRRVRAGDEGGRPNIKVGAVLTTPAKLAGRAGRGR